MIFFIPPREKTYQEGLMRFLIAEHLYISLRRHRGQCLGDTMDYSVETPGIQGQGRRRRKQTQGKIILGPPV